jgi:RNA-binding protein MEX3
MRGQKTRKVDVLLYSFVTGCKIKALRAKTNTYIKTPVRGEEAVFVVTGRREDVAAAKREILSAAEHFTQIRAQRKGNGSPTSGVGLPPGPPHIPGQITRPVRVPYKVVGLVVGPKGATIKRIQQQTHTYIVTPSRDREPVFEVTGLPDHVEMAKKEIENHIAFRTGGLADDEFNNHRPTPLINSFGLDNGFAPNDGNSSCSSSASSSTGSTSFLDNIPSFYGQPKMPEYNIGYTSLYSDDGSAIWSGSSGKSGWELSYNRNSLQSMLGNIGRENHPPARRFNSDPLGSGLSAEHSPADSTGSPSPPLSGGKRSCMVCFDSAVMAALIPCGHNFFCMECAQRICKSDGSCPVCQQPGQSAIRIISQN